MLKMENVSKTYRHRGQLVTALDNATVAIPRGDFVSVVGPSGSGKSTLLLMLGGMLSPSARPGSAGRSVGLRSEPERSCAAAAREGRLRLPDVQPGAVPFGPGERPGSAVSGQDGRRGPEGPGRGSLGTSRLGRPASPQAVRVERRPAAASRLGPDAGQRSGRDPGRRADRQSRPETSQQIIGFLEEFNAEGRTIVMVTHDPRAAKRAKRLLKLTRGTIVSAENVVDVSEKQAEDEEEARDAA